MPNRSALWSTAAITEAFAAAAGEGGLIAPDDVERVAAKLFNGVVTDGMLDVIIDLTDNKETVTAEDFAAIVAAVLAHTCTWGVLQTPISGPVGIESVMDQGARAAVSEPSLYPGPGGGLAVLEEPPRLPPAAYPGFRPSRRSSPLLWLPAPFHRHCA